MPNDSTNDAMPFTTADFERLLDRHGAKRERWPDAERSRAAALLEDSPKAQALLAEAQRLDDALDAWGRAPHPFGLATRIVANAQAHPFDLADTLFAWLTTKLWRTASMACAPLLLGFVFGAVVSGAEDPATFAALEESALVAFADDALVDFALPGEEQ